MFLEMHLVNSDKFKKWEFAFFKKVWWKGKKKKKVWIKYYLIAVELNKCFSINVPKSLVPVLDLACKKYFSK